MCRLPHATGPPRHIPQSQTTAARAAKHQTAVVLHHERFPERRPSMASTTLTLPAGNAIPPAAEILDRAQASILALDLGTTTGWAMRDGAGLITSGTVSFRPSRYDGGGIRYLRFRSWLDGIAAHAGQLGAVHFEEVRRHVGTDAAHVFGGLLATLSAWCEQCGIAYQGVPVGTIKRFIAGKGNADKQAMIAAIRNRGFEPTDDNEADAIAILLWAIETEGGVR